MTCRQVRERLAAHVNGELSAGDAAAVEAHLKGCAFCRSEAAAFERCEDALGALAAVEKAPDLSEDLRRRIAAPLAWRPRWGAAAAVAGAAAAVTAMAALLALPRKAPAPSAPIVREAVPPRAIAATVQATDVTAELPAEVLPPSRSRPASASAPRPVPAEVVSEQAVTPAVISVAVHAPPAGFEQETAMEAAPVMASLTTQRERAGGVVLLLGQPQAVRPASSCYLEVSLPDGARSVLERGAKVEAAGAPRVIQVSYEQIAPQPKAHDQGG